MSDEYWKYWYEVISDERGLRQGDIIRQTVVALLPHDLEPIAPPPAEPPPITCDMALGDWIVLSASCDVAERIENAHVLLARVLPADSERLGVSPGNPNARKELSEKVEVIRRGMDATRFLLAECPAIEPELPLSYVSYLPHALMPLSYVRRHCRGPRLRLRPPFREKFGQWAGTALSRVGIEDEAAIPRATKSLFAAQILRAHEGP
jgi:hypothetical protein